LSISKFFLPNIALFKIKKAAPDEEAASHEIKQY